MERRKKIFRYLVEKSMVSSGLTMLEKLRCLGYTSPFFEEYGL